VTNSLKGGPTLPKCQFLCQSNPQCANSAAKPPIKQSALQTQKTTTKYLGRASFALEACLLIAAQADATSCHLALALWHTNAGFTHLD